MAASYPIGIDIGNTHYRVSVWKDGKAEIVPDADGHHCVPTYIAFVDDEVLIGNSAKDLEDENPSNTIFDLVCLVGRDFKDPEFQEEMSNWPFTVEADDENKAVVRVETAKGTQIYTAEELITIIIEEAKQRVEKYVGATIHQVVLTVPYEFTNAQREVMRAAGQTAGLEVVRVLSKSSAVALQYIKQNRITEDEITVLVIDIGGSHLEADL